MIIFELQCNKGHKFEGWFDNHKDLTNQIKNKIIICPFCNNNNIHQVPSSFAISKRVNTSNEISNSKAIDTKSIYKLFNKSLKNYLQNNFEDVGSKFSSEALKMHYNITKNRNIRGISTPEEEEILRKEGVNFLKIKTPTIQGLKSPEKSEEEE